MATSKIVSNTTKIGVQCEYSEWQSRFIHGKLWSFLFTDKPQFIDVPEEINIEVNTSRIVKINAKGNPDILKYSWIKKDGTEIPSLNNFPLQREVTVSGPSLHLNNIQVEDGGTYIVRAKNYIGTSSKSIRVNVEYPPR